MKKERTRSPIKDKIPQNNFEENDYATIEPAIKQFKPEVVVVH